MNMLEDGNRRVFEVSIVVKDLGKIVNIDCDYRKNRFLPLLKYAEVC